IDTPLSVSREEFAPRVTLPLHFGPWFGVTSSATFRTTRYGDSLNSAGVVSGTPIVRNTGEFAVELRPPSFEGFFERGAKKGRVRRKFRHSIEPEITYRYVTGVDNFADFIRFDSDAPRTVRPGADSSVRSAPPAPSHDRDPRESQALPRTFHHVGALSPGCQSFAERCGIAAARADTLQAVKPDSCACGLRQRKPQRVQFYRRRGLRLHERDTAKPDCADKL